MFRTALHVTFLAVLLLALPLYTAKAQGRYGRQSVVYQIDYPGGDDNARYFKALQTIRNHINAVGRDNLRAVLVVFNQGIDLLKAAKSNMRLKAALVGLKGDNLQVDVCAKTIRDRKINVGRDLYDVFDEDIVPSGVAEIVRLEQMGYSYVKP